MTDHRWCSNCSTKFTQVRNAERHMRENPSCRYGTLLLQPSPAVDQSPVRSQVHNETRNDHDNDARVNKNDNNGDNTANNNNNSSNNSAAGSQAGNDDDEVGFNSYDSSIAVFVAPDDNATTIFNDLLASVDLLDDDMKALQQQFDEAFLLADDSVPALDIRHFIESNLIDASNDGSDDDNDVDDNNNNNNNSSNTVEQESDADWSTTTPVQRDVALALSRLAFRGSVRNFHGLVMFGSIYPFMLACLFHIGHQCACSRAASEDPEPRCAVVARFRVQIASIRRGRSTFEETRSVAVARHSRRAESELFHSSICA